MANRLSLGAAIILTLASPALLAEPAPAGAPDVHREPTSQDGDKETGQTIKLNHEQQGSQVPFGLIGVNEGDVLTIELQNTAPQCFDYNSEAVQPKDKTSPTAAREKETVEFRIIHDGVATGYKITATKKTPWPESICKLVTLGAYEHTVLVRSYGWRLTTTGAFTVDMLTNPSFSLEPGTQDGKTGYFVRNNPDQGNAANLGLAAMLNIYYDRPNTLCLAGRDAFCWVPLSFGLGIDTSGKAKYFFGTSFRFSTKLFVTGGYVLGPVTTLPNGVTVGSFTENANILNSLPTRTGGAFFGSVSYAFGTVNLDAFANMFKAGSSTQTPAPEGKAR